MSVGAAIGLDASDLQAIIDADPSRFIGPEGPAGGAGSHTGKKTLFGVGAAQNTWTTVAVPGAPADAVIEVLMYHRLNNRPMAGIRATGSTVDRTIEIARYQSVVMFVQADAASNIELWTGTNGTDFYLIGIVQ